MSTPAKPVFVVMLGGVSGGSLERLLRGALEASALDTIDAALATGRFDRALLLTDAPPALPLPAGVTVEVDGAVDSEIDSEGAGHSEAAPFQFGARLAEAVRAHGIERLVYAGAGAGPLLRGEHLEALADGIAADDSAAVCVTNNYYSADLFALRPASLIASLNPPPDADNGVPRRLREEHDIETRELSRSIETQLNLDSPTDLVALALTGEGGPRLTALLRERVQLEAPGVERLGRAAEVLTDREGEVLVAGRVSSRTWQYLERETACRVRVLAEERGMTAAGRDADGSARSLLGELIAARDPQACFGELLPSLCDAAFLDIRPALVHLGLHASRADRFAADLGVAHQIEEPALREIVAAANASPVPVVLGGHSLVAGVLMLVNDWAWAEHDRREGLA